MTKQTKHQSIIKAASKVFARKGFFNARISDVAKEAKIADGTVYLYFNNKTDILLSIFKEGIEQLHRQVKGDVDKQNHPQTKLKVFIKSHLTYMKRHRYLSELLQTELHQPGKAIRDCRNNYFYDYATILTDIISQGQAAKEFRQDVCPLLAGKLILGGLNEIIKLWIAGQPKQHKKDYHLDDVVKQTSTMFLNGLSTNDL